MAAIPREGYVIVRFLFAVACVAVLAGPGYSAEDVFYDEYEALSPRVLVEDFSDSERLISVGYSVGHSNRIAVYAQAHSGQSVQRVFDLPVIELDPVPQNHPGFYGPLYILDINGDERPEVLVLRSGQHSGFWRLYAGLEEGGDWNEVVAFITGGFAGLPSPFGVRVSDGVAQISGMEPDTLQPMCWTWRAGVPASEFAKGTGTCWSEANWSGLEMARRVSLQAFSPAVMPRSSE